MKAGLLAGLATALVVILALQPLLAPGDVSSPEEGLVFYVIGDTQGYLEPFQQMLEDAETERPDLIFHLGDITPSGTQGQYQKFLDAIENMSIPLYTTPGNHEAKGNLDDYVDHFGPLDYSFSMDNCAFISVSSALENVNESQFQWLEEELNSALGAGRRSFVFTHVPPLDVAVEDHAFLSNTSGQRFVDLMAEYDVNAVFNGHVHVYNKTEHQCVPYYTSGGGGAALYANESEGGFYHYLRVSVKEEGFSVEPVVLEPPQKEDVLTVRWQNDEFDFTLQELLVLPVAEGYGSFQNRYGNWGGQGWYAGVEVKHLLEQFDLQGANISFIATDGYNQNLGVGNIEPSTQWLAIQGKAIIAYSFNNQTVPDWQNGPRLMFLPDDGGYSNQDAEDTTPTGFVIPASAGERCVRNVRYIDIQ